MSVIRVPKPRGKFDPSRPVSSLLSTQIQHLHEAEKNLPPRYHSEHYIKAIRTEGEAAEYIRDVTEAIYRAHADAKARRARPARREILPAAAGEEKSAAKRAGGTKAKKSRTRSIPKP